MSPIKEGDSYEIMTSRKKISQIISTKKCSYKNFLIKREKRNLSSFLKFKNENIQLNLNEMDAIMHFLNQEKSQITHPCNVTNNYLVQKEKTVYQTDTFSSKVENLHKHFLPEPQLSTIADLCSKINHYTEFFAIDFEQNKFNHIFISDRCK